MPLNLNENVSGKNKNQPPLGSQLWEEAGKPAAWPCAGGGGREPAKPACNSEAHS